MKISWRYGVIAGLVLAAFSLFPQAKLIYQRGAEWNGHFAYIDVDEAAYAAYLNALISGRPRKNDPYTGRDDAPGTAKAESIFSIQFAAPYAIALPARIFGVSADLAMVIAGGIAAFLTGLTIFWVVGMITGDSLFAMTASLATVCFGTLAAGEGAVREILLYDEIAYPFLPGFRRYVPALAFPAFFAFCCLLWRLMTRGTTIGQEQADEKPAATDSSGSFRTGLAIALAGLCFGFIVFSYFYLWTAAAAFLICLTAILAVARPAGWIDSAVKLLSVGLCCLVVLLPYGWLLSNRESSIDMFQMAVNSRAPDLFRFPEIVVLAACLLLIVAALVGKRVGLSDLKVLFIFSLIASVFFMLNQQVITGVSLQPIHYQVFVGNYVAVLALVLAGWTLAGPLGLRDRSAWPVCVLCLAGAAVIWGAVECQFNSSVLDETNIRLDAFLPVATRLRSAAAADPNLANVTVLSYDLLLADMLPGVAPQNVLWARHQAVFSGLGKDEAERRFFCYLYYLEIDGVGLEQLLRTDNVTITALFGWDRHTDRLSVDAKPLDDMEIMTMVARYDRFRHEFSRADAAAPRLSFVIVPEGSEIDLANLRQWYDLDEGEPIGGNILYRVHLHDWSGSHAH